MSKKLRHSLLERTPRSSSRSTVNIYTADPNLLKDRLYKSLMEMSEDDRNVFVHRLFTSLRTAGVNINNHMLLLGCNPNELLDATANDVAQLIRYYRINLPSLLDVVSQVSEQFPSLKQSLAEFPDQEMAA